MSSDDDVMEWMINTQLGRRNLPPQQRIAVVKKFEKKIQEQAQKKYTETVGRPTKSNNRSPNGEQLNAYEKIHTDKELAKLAGVGTGTIARFNRVMSSDDEVMEWMLDIQLGRRNLSPIQRIAVAEKYRPIYERQALFNKQLAMQMARKSNPKNANEQFTENLPQTENIDIRNPTTDKKLSDIAGVSEKTYRMGAKILQSDDEQLKQEVLSGQKSISAGYKELTTSTDEPNSAQRKSE